jgi:hypothetical protein
MVLGKEASGIRNKIGILRTWQNFYWRVVVVVVVVVVVLT